MAQAVENSSIVLICMNEQYKQSYYCRLGSFVFFSVFIYKNFFFCSCFFLQKQVWTCVFEFNLSIVWFSMKRICNWIEKTMHSMFNATTVSTLRLGEYLFEFFIDWFVCLLAWNYQRSKDSCWFCDIIVRDDCFAFVEMQIWENFWFSFDEAFALLIREIETIRSDQMAKSDTKATLSSFSHLPTAAFNSSDAAKNQSLYSISILEKKTILQFLIKNRT